MKSKRTQIIILISMLLTINGLTIYSTNAEIIKKAVDNFHENIVKKAYLNLDI